MQRYNLDRALREYSLGCSYDVVEDDTHPRFGGFWFTNYVPGVNEAPAPDDQTLYDISEALIAEGVFLEMPESVNSYIAMTQLPIYEKIVSSAETDPSILLYAVLAQQAIVTALSVRSQTVLDLAKTAWARFVSIAKRRRLITNVNDADIVMWNEFVDINVLPGWLKVE